MDIGTQLREIMEQYGNVPADQITDDMRIREEMGLNSLDLMTLLGEIEDTFDIELEVEHAARVFTIGELVQLIEELSAE